VSISCGEPEKRVCGKDSFIGCLDCVDPFPCFFRIDETLISKIFFGKE